MATGSNQSLVEELDEEGVAGDGRVVSSCTLCDRRVLEVPGPSAAATAEELDEPAPPPEVASDAEAGTARASEAAAVTPTADASPVRLRGLMSAVPFEAGVMAGQLSLCPAGGVRRIGGTPSDLGPATSDLSRHSCQIG